MKLAICWRCAVLGGLIAFTFAPSTFAARGAKEERTGLDAAWDAWDEGNPARAGTLVRDLIEKDGQLVSSLRAALLLARTAADAEESLERWEHVLGLEPEKGTIAEARWMRAMAASALGQHERAIEELDHLARENRRDFDRGKALLAKGIAQIESGEPGDALESLGVAARVAKEADDRRSAELALASANYRLGNLREALRRYDKFERDHAKDDRARWAAWRGILCLRLLGRESDAAERTARLEGEAPGTLEAVLAREEIRMGDKSPASARATPKGETVDERPEDPTDETGKRGAR